MGSGAYFAGVFDTTILFLCDILTTSVFNSVASAAAPGAIFAVFSNNIITRLKMKCRIIRVCRSYDTGLDKTVIWEFDARISALLN